VWCEMWVRNWLEIYRPPKFKLCSWFVYFLFCFVSFILFFSFVYVYFYLALFLGHDPLLFGHTFILFFLSFQPVVMEFWILVKTVIMALVAELIAVVLLALTLNP